MTFSVFRSTDPLAPTLSGQAGSLITLLDTCLVNGYTVSAYNAAGSVAYSLNDLAVPTSANGLYYKVTTAGTTAATEPTWPTTTGATVTDGTVVWTCLGTRPVALGWTKPYTGTNKAAYRMATTGSSSGGYLRVDDSFTSTNAKWAGLTGYVAMTTVDAGTDPFPTTQNYCGIQKSATADAVARSWVLVGDEYRFYLLVQGQDNNAADWDVNFFGDIKSYLTSDPYKCLIATRYATTVSSMTYSTNYLTYMNHYSWAGNSGLHMPRNHAAAAGAIQVGMHTDSFLGGAGAYSSFYMGAQGNLAYPNVANNGIFMAPVWVHQTTISPYVLRGHLPGMWAPLHARPLGNNDTFAGSGNMAGKTFEAFYARNGGQVLLEMSNTWS